MCGRVIGYISVGEGNEYVGRRRFAKVSEFLDTLGYAEKEILIDEGFSGAIWENPQIKKAVGKISRGEVSAFVVGSMFDLGRCFGDSAGFMKFLAENGVRLICIDNNIDTLAYESFDGGSTV